jgi:hypothetical protein
VFCESSPSRLLRAQLRDNVDEVLRPETVDATAADQWQQLVELNPVLVAGRVRNVEARCLPFLRGLCERRRRRLLPVQIGNALRGELAADPGFSFECLAPGSE